MREVRRGCVVVVVVEEGGEGVNRRVNKGKRIIDLTEVKHLESQHLTDASQNRIRINQSNISAKEKGRRVPIRDCLVCARSIHHEVPASCRVLGGKEEAR